MRVMEGMGNMGSCLLVFNAFTYLAYTCGRSTFVRGGKMPALLSRPLFWFGLQELKLAVLACQTGVSGGNAGAVGR